MSPSTTARPRCGTGSRDAISRPAPARARPSPRFCMTVLPARLSRRLRAAGDGEAGYNIVEFMLTFVALIVITMILIQFALLWHARHVAQAAAQDALRTASDYQSTAAAGQSDGYDYLHQVAPHLVLNPQVAVTRSATTVTVEVTGGVLSVGPFHLTVRESASGPVERRSP